MSGRGSTGRLTNGLPSSARRAGSARRTPGQPHAVLEDLLVRPQSLRPNGLMGLKPLRQRQEHDRRTLRADVSEGDARQGRSPEGLGRMRRARAPACSISTTPSSRPSRRRRPKRAIRWPRPGSSIKSCAACAPVSSSSTSSTIVCAAAGATSRRSSPCCAVSGVSTTFRRRSSAKPPSMTTSI
jgi:hypothetical protein